MDGLTAPPPRNATAAPGLCDVAVIVPVLGHPALVSEAFRSVLAQIDPPALRIVVVIDGCTLPETAVTVAAWARAHPGLFAVLHQPHRGLAAARNAGLRFALAAWPELRAVFFLDADNRIGPHLLRRALHRLLAAPAPVGWVYLDLDMFGTPGHWSTAGVYSLLQHLAENVCDAGAMVRREVFEAGIAFRDALDRGYEDWDFWLAAAARGFRGLHLPAAGFAYRRRPESLVQTARRRGPALRDALHAQHRALYAPRALLALEAEEAPRYAILERDGATSLLDPAEEAPPGPIDTLFRTLAEAARAPGEVHAPRLLACAAPGTMAALRRHGLARGVFALAERLLAEAPVTAITLDHRRGCLALCPAGPPTAGAAALLFLDPRRLAAPGGIDLSAPPPRTIAVALPEPPGVTGDAAGIAAAASRALATIVLPRRRVWRKDGRIARAEAAGTVAREVLGAAPLLPLAPQPPLRDIGLVVPGFGLGGVERVLARLAGAFARAGWRPHLFVTGQEAIAAPPPGTFASVTLLPGMDAERQGGEAGAYFGAGTAAITGESPEQAAAVLGLLAPMQAVLVTHAFAGHALAGRLRDMGIATACALHLSERGPFGQPEGTPHIALAYEHAYDVFAVHSERLAAWCAAAGIPESKIVLVPNAPGYDPDPSRPPPVRAPLGGRRLRALVLGRLDRQKGPDRLPAIIAATDTRVEWRVVGRAELDRAVPQLPVPVEPAVFDAAALDALYAWADVLVLPSRFEGVPLSVLEAQRAGCVPVATAVGGLPEAVTDGADGLLVEAGEDAAVQEALAAALLRLAADPALTGRLSDAAARRGAARDWSVSAAALIGALDRRTG